MRHVCRIAVSLVILAAWAAAVAPAGAAPAKSSAGETDRSLDDELLGDLGGESPAPQRPRPPADTSEKPQAKSPQKADKPQPSKAPVKTEDPLDAALRDSLGGEDFGQPGEARENKLASVVRQMRAVQRQLERSPPDAQTVDRQKQIARQLAAAIEEMQQQAQSNSQSSSSGQSSTSPSNRGTPQQPQSADGGKPDNGRGGPEAPSKESDPNLHRKQKAVAAAASVRAALEKALDHLSLPAKQREQMLDAPADEFLPKYEQTIKKYFERLSEDDAAP